MVALFPLKSTSCLVGKCLEPSLKRFMLAATDDAAADKEWLEALVMIVADKPAESWKDEDVTGFENKLSDVARRFRNLEALQTEVATSIKDGFEARRVTVTRPDGQEIHQMVWFDNERQAQIECLFDKILGILSQYDNPQLQQAVIAKLAEKVLDSASQEQIKAINQSKS